MNHILIIREKIPQAEEAAKLRAELEEEAKVMEKQRAAFEETQRRAEEVGSY
jgi:hypothetical protein